MSSLALAFRFARRELRGGFAGFRIFFMCLLLGAASISGVESLSEAFLGGLADQSQTILGGDVSVSLVHRPATPQELAFLERHGTVSQTQNMRAMAYVLRDLQPAERQLVEFKMVDGRWPLFGAPRLSPAIAFRDAIHCEDDGVCGLASEQVLLDRMHIRIGGLVIPLKTPATDIDELAARAGLSGRRFVIRLSSLLDGQTPRHPEPSSVQVFGEWGVSGAVDVMPAAWAAAYADARSLLVTTDEDLVARLLTSGFSERD